MEKPSFLSIGVPAFNEEESIERSLESILKQSLWREMPAERREIIVCANGCTDRTAEIVRGMHREHPEIRLLGINEQSKALAWNRIVRESNPEAEVVFFTDADVVLHRRALEKIWNRFRQEPRLELVGGRAVPININESKDPKVRARNLAIKETYKRSPHLSGSLYGIKRNTAKKIEMPPNLLTEDLYLRLITPDDRFAKEFGARVFYKPPTTQRDIIIQSKRISRGQEQLIKMGRLSKKESIFQRARKLKGLPFRQKIARIYFFGLGKLTKLAPPYRNPKWKKITTSKIPYKKRRRGH